MEIDLKHLGENIRYLRHGRGWSLADLAERSGISKAYISDVENGSGGRPNVQYVYRIATELETTIDALLNQDMKKPQKKGSTGSVARDEPLPPGLEQFAKSEGLEPDQVEMLARLNFRGRRPKDAEAWKLIFQSIKIASGS